MKILFLAPQPFFQERGTPIAVRLAVMVLAQRKNDEIDLLTYHEGENIVIPNARLHRISVPSWISGIKPGFSFKKIICDFFFLIATIKLIWKNRKQQYNIIHAVEESVFIALLVKVIWKIPYVYDMDSSMALQIVEKIPFIKPLLPIFQLFEKLAIKYSLAVVPVCDALAVLADEHGSYHTHIIRDVSLFNVGSSKQKAQNLKQEIGIPENQLVVLYIGNLEHYQGIDLLISAFGYLPKIKSKARLVIIGGADKDIEKYKAKASKLQIEEYVHLIGPRPVACLQEYLLQADILVSPRVTGNNTPMKIYSYLHSARPVLATKLPTHTQVLDETIARLAEPTKQRFSQALLDLINDESLRVKLGQAAYKLVEEKYTFNVFSRRLNKLYDHLSNEFIEND